MFCPILNFSQTDFQMIYTDPSAIRALVLSHKDVTAIDATENKSSS